MDIFFCFTYFTSDALSKYCDKQEISRDTAFSAILHMRPVNSDHHAHAYNHQSSQGTLLVAKDLQRHHADSED